MLIPVPHHHTVIHTMDDMLTTHDRARLCLDGIACWNGMCARQLPPADSWHVSRSISSCLRPRSLVDSVHVLNTVLNVLFT